MNTEDSALSVTRVHKSTYAIFSPRCRSCPIPSTHGSTRNEAAETEVDAIKSRGFVTEMVVEDVSIQRISSSPVLLHHYYCNHYAGVRYGSASLTAFRC